MARTYVSEGIDAHIGCGSHWGLSYKARVQTGAPGGIIDVERAGEIESEAGRSLRTGRSLEQATPNDIDGRVGVSGGRGHNALTD